MDFDRDMNYIKNDYPFLSSLFNMDKLLNLYYPELIRKTDSEILNFFINNKKFIFQQIRDPSNQLTNQWMLLNDEFFEQIERVTHFKWKHRKYFCHLSTSFICGGKYERPNTIVIFPRATHIQPLQTIPHELFHLHFWDFIENIGIELTNEKMSKIWDLSEVIDFILEDLEIKGLEYKSNLYPQHKMLYKKIKPMWKGNFDDFIKNSLKVVENMNR